jgi:glycosyltransferase involved in cell wall biosynthesis
MKVSVISPCRNEVNHIDEFLSAVTQQKCDGFALEIIIADGLSDDGTIEKIFVWAEKESRLKVVENFGRIVSTGLNKAISHATGEIIVRMDIHSTYAPDYINRCVEALRSSDAKCVGGPWAASGTSLKQSSIASAFQSRFGSGGAASRRLDYTGPVDTVYLGAWFKKDLIKVGCFDDELVRNQDDELCLRFTRDGGKIWQSASIRSTYRPRNSFKSLFKQFYQYGYWKALVLKKHKMPASPRHLVPFFFVVSLFLLLLSAPFSELVTVMTVFCVTIYVSLSIVFALRAKSDAGILGVLLTSFAFWTMHFGYGIGFGLGFLDFIILNRTPSRTMRSLSR